MSKAKFNKNHFLVIKEAIDPKIAEFVYNYFLVKRQVADTLFKTKSGLKIFKNKSIFKVDLNENNNLVKIFQFKNIYQFSKQN